MKRVTLNQQVVNTTALCLHNERAGEEYGGNSENLLLEHDLLKLLDDATTVAQVRQVCTWQFHGGCVDRVAFCCSHESNPRQTAFISLLQDGMYVRTVHPWCMQRTFMFATMYSFVANLR